MQRTHPQSTSGRGMRPEDAQPALKELESALETGRETLEQQDAQEADLRDRLFELKRTYEEASKYWLVLEISRTTRYNANVKELRDQLLARARALNPQITTWEKAIDPKLRVSEISTRKGKKDVRPFQPPIPMLRMTRVMEGTADMERTTTGPSDPERSERSQEEGSDSTESRPLHQRSALQVPLDVQGAQCGDQQSKRQAPVGAGSRSLSQTSNTFTPTI